MRSLSQSERETAERERMQGLFTAPAAASPVTAALLRRWTAGTQQVQHALPGRAPLWRRQRSHQGNFFLSAIVIKVFTSASFGMPAW